MNAAFRVKKILKLTLGYSNIAMGDIWASIFDISESDPIKKNFEISKCLNNLHDEIELIREQMHSTNFSHFLFEHLLDGANNIVAVQNIQQNWESYKPQITPELILCLGFCSEILAPEENEIPDEQINEILDLLIILEESIKESALPAYTTKIIKKHIDKIKDAIHSYKITGTKAFNEAIQSAYGVVIDNSVIFEESKSSQEIKNLSEVWKKIKIISDAATIMDKGISSVYSLADKATKLLGIFN